MKNEVLVEFVKLLVEKKLKEFQLSDGTVLEWGSNEHITALESQLSEIQHRKSKHPRGSSARADYRRVESRLRSELKSAKKAAENRRLQEKQTVEGI
jgi:hypothetical protein